MKIGNNKGTKVIKRDAKEDRGAVKEKENYALCSGPYLISPGGRFDLVVPGCTGCTGCTSRSRAVSRTHYVVAVVSQAASTSSLIRMAVFVISIFADTNGHQMQMLLLPTLMIKPAVKFISQVVKSLKRSGGSDIAAQYLGNFCCNTDYTTYIMATLQVVTLTQVEENLAIECGKQVKLLEFKRTDAGYSSCTEPVKLNSAATKFVKEFAPSKFGSKGVRVQALQFDKAARVSVPRPMLFVPTIITSGNPTISGQPLVVGTYVRLTTDASVDSGVHGLIFLAD
ncbi:hypothetical protein V501_01021 [Pseudogymnoascus sp. VKM F-4519 (FW-2642)]|nr:hypothetical protein V501_01021 [Pseudogymnoascus sp. VKM F-4519 (FW-2642)]